MAELKTQKTQASVAGFLQAIADETRRKDAKAVDRLMREVTGEKPAMWGPAIVGYGQRTITYDSGRTLDWMRVGFSPRKAALVLYLTCDLAAHADLTAKLGKHSTGKGCLYIKKLADVDPAVLRKLIATCVPD